MGIKIGNTDISKIKIASGLTPRLPSAYQEVEYIESSGTQRIDTGVMPTSDTINQFKVMFLAWSGDVVYGYNYDDNTANYRLFNAYGYPNGTTFNNGALIFDTTHSNSYARIETGQGYLSLNTIYEFELGDYYVKDLSTGTNILTGTAGTVTDSGNYTITLNNYRDTKYSKNRWYYVKIFEGATQIRDLVPCYRIADDVIGMYDLINDTFYTNNGSGTFIKGSDVVVDQYKDIKKVYLGSTQVRPTGWQPGANTVGYRPLDSANTVNDLSSNSNNGTINGTVTFGTNLGVDCGAFLRSGYITIPYSNSMNTTNITISCWCAIASGYSSNNGGIIAKTALSNGHGPYHIANLSNFRFSINRDALSMDESMFSGNNQWVYITCDYNGTTAHVYKNGVLIDTDSYTYDISGDTNPLVLGAYYSSNYKMNGFLSNVIIENKIRTAQEVADYFNLTKGDYGIS